MPDLPGWTQANGALEKTRGRSAVATPVLRDFVSVKDFAALGDFRTVTDAAMTSGQATVTSATAAFTSADVGKRASVVGASSVNATLHTTIASVQSPTQATLANNAGVTVAGATAGFGTDNFGVFQTAWDAVANAGGGVVYHPEGKYGWACLVDGTPLTPAAANVTYRGAGAAKTTFYPMGGGHGISRQGALAAQLTDLAFEDFTIDGIFQYGVAPYYVKAVFMNYMLRPKFRRLHVKNSPASGLGVDYLQDYEIDSCLCENNGRLGTAGSSPGGAGIGIGTGKYTYEAGYVRNCICRGNKNYGLFYENQGLTTTIYSSGAQVKGGRFEGNWRGIGDCGVKALIVEGAHIADNGNAGMAVDASHISPEDGIDPGFDGRISGCTITSNASHGVLFDYGSGAQNGRYVLAGNLIKSNGACGVKVIPTTTVPAIVISDNDVINNGTAGIEIIGGTLADSEIIDNRCYSNGQSTTTPYGIRFKTVTLLRCRVNRNKCAENGLGTAARQTHGIFVEADATLNTSEIRDNKLDNNLTAGLSQGGTTTGICPIERNAGYNPVGVANLAVTASPMAISAGQQRTDFYILGGTINPIAINGTNVYVGGANAGTITITLEPGDSGTITYTVAPTAIKTYKH
jgi:hypothetical protein